jgi:hypothetical protein
MIRCVVAVALLAIGLPARLGIGLSMVRNIRRAMVVIA